MKNVLNVAKISLRPIFMSLIILFGSSFISNAKIACAANHQNSPGKTSNSSDNTNGAAKMPRLICFDLVAFLENEDENDIELTEDTLKIIDDLCKSEDCEKLENDMKETLSGLKKTNNKE